MRQNTNFRLEFGPIIGCLSFILPTYEYLFERYKLRSKSMCSSLQHPITHSQVQTFFSTNFSACPTRRRPRFESAPGHVVCVVQKATQKQIFSPSTSNFPSQCHSIAAPHPHFILLQPTPYIPCI